MSNIEQLFYGDPRLESICDEILEVLYRRANGVSIPAVVGILELAKQQIINDARLED